LLKRECGKKHKTQSVKFDKASLRVIWSRWGPLFGLVARARVEWVEISLIASLDTGTTARNGMHKYDNQDHGMMTAMLCVENILADAKLYDLCQVNADAEYHEQGDEVSDEKNGSALRLVPTRADPEPELASEA